MADGSPSKKAKTETTYKGGCHCGEVEFEATGEPKWSAICHCSICRRTHSTPYAELCAYDTDKLKVTKGEDHLNMYNCRGKSKEDRYSCKTCGAKVYSMLNHLGCKAAFLQNFTTPNHGSDGKIDSKFAPTCHILYGSGTISNHDKLSKFNVLPTAFGGDGKELPDDHHDTKDGADHVGEAGTFKGSCHCGDVEFEVKDKPKWAANCHCSICRRCHSGPYAELCAYDDDKVTVTKGAENLTMYNCDGKSKEDRHFCKTCTGRIYSKLNHLGCKAVFLQNLTSPNHGADGKIDPAFAPNCHILYGSGTISNFDKLPKFNVLPEAFGGDGKELANDYHDTR